LLILGERFAEIALALDARLDQVIAVDRRRHRDRVAPCLPELEHRRLSEYVLEDDAIGTQEQITSPRLHLLMLGIVEMPQQDLVGKRQRAPEAPSDDGEIALHRLINPGGHLGRGLDRDHALNPLRNVAANRVYSLGDLRRSTKYSRSSQPGE